MKSHGAGTKRRGLVFVCGLLPVLATAVLAVYRPGLVPRADDAVYDTVMRSSRIAPPGNHVVIVDLDERSLSTIGQWPWRRDVIGSLIARLRDLGASVVALDIIFAEPDRLVLPASNVQGTASTPDEVLSQVLGEGRVVLGFALTFDRGPHQANRCVLHPIGLAVVHPSEDTGGT